MLENAEATAWQRLSQSRKKLEHTLAKRVAELECLYRLFTVFETPGLPLEVMYNNTLEGIIQGWSWPEVACVRLRLGKAVYATDNFRETPWRLQAPVKSEERQLGLLEVGYLEPRPLEDEGPFLVEERELLEAVAGRLGRIIERRLARDELKRERDFARNLLETAQAAVLVLDPQGKILHGNQFTEGVLGRPLWQIKGWDFFQNFLPEPQRDLARRGLLGPDPVQEGQVFPLLGQDGQSRQLEWRVRPLLDETGQVRGLLCTGQDLTQRLEMENRLKLLAGAVEQAAEAIVITDAQGRITYLNPACERLSGYSNQEARGKAPRLVRDGADLFRAILVQLSQGQVWSGRLDLVRKSGEDYVAQCSISPIRQAGEQVVAYVAHLRDITMELRLQEHLRQSQRMGAMGTLAGGIAHDFNNILGAIIGYAELAKMNVDRPGQFAGYLDLSLRACQRAKDLVGQILTFSRQSEQERKPVDLIILLKESLKLLRATLPTTIEMVLNLEPATAPVLADPTQLHQMVMNLCTNAAHAMREGGGKLEIALKARVLQVQDLALHPGLGPGQHLLLSVSDTGQGMTPEVATKIFDPFFTTKAPGEGTGLGLSVVHGIVTSSGGTIRVYSEPGRGTTFNILLPLLKQAAEEPAEPEQDPPRGKERILLVDDEEALVDILVRMLEGLGYRVSPFISPTLALRAFKESPQDFDLVLSDLTMPHMTGLDLARQVSALRPGLPFLLCTGFSETLTEARAAALGIREVVFKPIQRQSLAQTLRRALTGTPNPGAAGTP